MFKSQLVLLSLQIGPGFSPKANRPLFPLFFLPVFPASFVFAFLRLRPFEARNKQDIGKKMGDWKWIKQSNILAPFCFHRIQPRSQVSLLFVLQGKRKRTLEMKGDK